MLARATPLIIIDPIAGHEEWNADFVAGSGAGIQLRYPDGVALAARYLVADKARLALMRRQAQRVGRPRAALDVAARSERSWRAPYGDAGSWYVVTVSWATSTGATPLRSRV